MCTLANITVKTQMIVWHFIRVCTVRLLRQNPSYNIILQIITCNHLLNIYNGPYLNASNFMENSIDLKKDKAPPIVCSHYPYLSLLITH